MGLSPEEFRVRKRELIDQERKNPPGWWYLSFANQDGFLGGCVVQGQGPATALDRSWRLRINPGDCEVGMFRVSDKELALLPPEAREKLLSKAELERLLGPVERVDPREDG